MINLKKKIFLSVFFALLAVVFLFYIFFVPHFFIYRHEQHVDISSGRVRSTRYLCNIKISEQIEDSVITNALDKDSLDDTEDNWNLVYKKPFAIGPGKKYSTIAPRFRGALWIIKSVEEMWQTASFTPEAKKEISETVIHIWQFYNHNHNTSIYIRKIENSVKSNAKITTENLPKWSEDQAEVAPCTD